MRDPWGLKKFQEISKSRGAYFNKAYLLFSIENQGRNKKIGKILRMLAKRFTLAKRIILVKNLRVTLVLDVDAVYLSLVFLQGYSLPLSDHV